MPTAQTDGLTMRYKLTIEYVGTLFQGWQIQGTDPTVQKILMDAFQEINDPVTIVYGAGRTDAGVHALGQVAHVDLCRAWDPFRLQQALNTFLREKGVSIVGCQRVQGPRPGALSQYTLSLLPQGNNSSVDTTPDVLPYDPVVFHARFSATCRHYVYHILNRDAVLALDQDRCWQVFQHLDVAAMVRAAKIFVGSYDFSVFRSRKCQSASAVRTVRRVDIEAVGQKIHIHISSQSFLHHQVRFMVGALKWIGEGRWTEDDLIMRLPPKDYSKDNGGQAWAFPVTNMAPLAPAYGLYLKHVEYGSDYSVVADNGGSA